MNSSTRLALILGLSLAAGAAFTACGGDDEPAEGGGGDNGGPAGTLQLTYAPMYSAFVPNHEAQVPVSVKGVKGAKFTSTDPSVAVVTDTADGATVTVKKEGSTTIRATGPDGDTGAAKLTVKGYTEAQWAVGEERYSRPASAINPPNGGAVTAIALVNPAARDAAGACNTCHTAQAKTLKIENTPTQIAGYSDDELITIFTMGKKPSGAEQKSMIPAFIWGMVHAWTVTEEEKQGLIAYLRTQAPKANPAEIDYGVRPCPGQTGTGAMTMLCDNAGNPLPIPGRRDGGTPPATNTDSGTPTTSTDAGTPTTSTDAGSTTTTPDAGTPATGGDAG